MDLSQATVLHTSLPSYQGERDVVRSLVEFQDGSLHVWCGLNFIPGCNDIDLLVIDKGIGAFVVEIKAVPLSAIEEVTYSEWSISGRGRKISPVFQAFRAMGNLSEYLKSRVKHKPFMVATACLPTISRGDWINAFEGTDFVGNYAEGILFADDLAGGYEVLAERLRAIYRRPPVGTPRAQYCARGANEFWVSQDNQITALASALNPSARPKSTPTDIIRLKAIESGVSSKMLKDYPPDTTHFGMFRGAAGTGKTFRLIQILVNFAYAGKSTLLCCFNKTLAADIRRLLSFSEKIRLVENYPDVFDFFHLASEDCNLLSMPVWSDESPNTWFDKVVHKLQETKERLPSYDLIVVDESQELRESEKELLRMHLKPGGSLFFSLGEGQEVYNDRTPFAASDALSFFAELNAGVVPSGKTLRRNFRNSRKVFLGALLFHRCYGEKKRTVRKELEKVTRNSGYQVEIRFDRESLGALNIEILSEEGLPDREDSFFPMAQEKLMVDKYVQLIRSAYEGLSKNDSPIDILILVPGPTGLVTDWVKAALRQFEAEEGVGFNDLCDEKNRRHTCENDKIRLCSFHSSRGLEGGNVMVFGFDRLEYMAKKLEFSANNLGYIALSRAIVCTTVVLPPFSSAIKFLLEEIGRELSAGIDIPTDLPLSLE